MDIYERRRDRIIGAAKIDKSGISQHRFRVHFLECMQVTRAGVTSLFHLLARVAVVGRWMEHAMSFNVVTLPWRVAAGMTVACHCR